MDVVRRNTDYAARLMVHLAKHYGNGPISTRAASAQEHVPYQLACKLMQKLNNAKLVESCMGPKGGFVLGKEPSKISLLEVVEVIQGPINMNRCLLGEKTCPQQITCTVRNKLANLQKNINNGLAAITFDELTRKEPKNKNIRNTKRRKQ
jgi:Rrf2 family protein